MKYVWSLMLIILSAYPMYADNKGVTKNQAINIVTSFYKGLQKLSQSDVNEFNSLAYEYIYPNLIDREAFNHPNDVQPLFANSGGDFNAKRIVSYMRLIQNKGLENGLRLDYKICDITNLKEVEYQDMKERLVMTYWSVSVEKKFTLDGRIYSLTDTVDVKIYNGKIAFISNKYYRADTPYIKGEDNHHILIQHNEMLARAARCWTQGRKREAYNYYVRSVENYEDPDTYFRIGVLLIRHYKQCTNYNKSDARDLAKSYFTKASDKGHEEAKRVLHWYFDDRNRGSFL